MVEQRPLAVHLPKYKHDATASGRVSTPASGRASKAFTRLRFVAVWRTPGVLARQAARREKISDVFWPPKPKLLFITCRQRIWRAVLGT